MTCQGISGQLILKKPSDGVVGEGKNWFFKGFF